MADRQNERRERRGRKALSARAIVAGVLVLFVILQGLASTVSSLAHSARLDEAGPVASFLAATCSIDVDNEESDPAHRRHGRSQCCLLCDGRDLGFAPPRTIVKMIEASTPPRSFRFAEFVLDEAPPARLVGWASSWSSQAPPLFS